MLRIDAVVLGDEPGPWRDAGFVVDDDGVTSVGTTAIVCVGDGAPPRLRLWADDGPAPVDLDGIETSSAREPRAGDRTSHPNRVVEIDHVVLASPDLDRTTEAFAALGVECRRIRDVPGSDPAMQQRFFRLGPIVAEVVGTAGSRGDGPTAIWGLAFTVDDIDAAASRLGPVSSAPKDAVQPGRRIATIRTRDLGISLPIALMSEPPPRR